MFQIAAVERDTGISKDTLRVWERRYGFPQPLRDAHGDRRYPEKQVEKLKVLKRLLEQGFRPGQIVPASLAELAVLHDREQPETQAPTGDANEVTRLLKAHELDALRDRLQQLLLRQGLQRFVMETVAPLNAVIGQAWMRGALAIFEEHAYSELITGMLRNAIATTSVPRAPPRILITTLPGEEHGLGVLMVEALAAVEGTTCISFGVQTPVLEVAAASRAHGADIVALSFSSAYGARQAKASLYEVRARIPLTAELWAGGGAVLGMRRPPDGVVIVRSLDGLADEIARWRSTRPTRAPASPA